VERQAQNAPVPTDADRAGSELVPHLVRHDGGVDELQGRALVAPRGESDLDLRDVGRVQRSPWVVSACQAWLSWL